MSSQAPEPTFVGRSRSAGFGSLLLMAMAVGTATAWSLGIIATFVIDDLAISREQLGWVVTATVVGAGLLSPYAGTVTDRVGGKRAIMGLFVASAASFLLIAVAPFYAAMFLGAACGAVAQAGGNPSTNKLIALHIPAGRRGVVTGIKQSGVQLGIFLGGVLLPFLAEEVGWRWALAMVAVVAGMMLVPAKVLVPSDRPDGGEGAASDGVPLPSAITWLAVYGFLLGFGGSVTFFLALFVEESLGRSPRLGGLVVGMVGLLAIFGRIGWARLAERRGEFVMSLTAIALLSVVASVAFLLAVDTVVLLWVGVVLTALSSSSWNSVGMLAVMDEAGMERAGRASGIVMLGFLVGLGIGPPIFGRSIDSTGSYDFMWMASIGTFVLASAVALLWSRIAPDD